MESQLQQNGQFLEVPSIAIFNGCGYCTQVFMEEKHLQTHIRYLHDGAPYRSVPAAMPPHMAELLHQPATKSIMTEIPMSEVQRHDQPEDCWIALNGHVYDLTEFLDRHPGGKNVIVTWAGKDASKIFNEIHQTAWIEQYLRPEAHVGTLGLDPDLLASDTFWHSLRLARIEEIRNELKILVGGDSLSGRDPVPETSKDTGIPLSVVAQHHTAKDCWVVVNGLVYDLSDILLRHPEQIKVISAWAGRDASKMWNRIPGRFPSREWHEQFIRPEDCLGEVGPDKVLLPREALRLQLEDELHRLEGPMQKPQPSRQMPSLLGSASERPSELDRFPRLLELQEKVAGLPRFTRAEVSRHTAAADSPYIILHNKVYNLKPLLGSHPGGDAVLLQRAGTDATDDFEVFEHSEKARLKRDSELLLGELVAEDWTKPGAAPGSTEGLDESWGSILRTYALHKVLDMVVFSIALYAYMAVKYRRPLSRFSYSRSLRHMHLIMGLGIATSIGTAQLAIRSEGRLRKLLMDVHRKTGVAILLALPLRGLLRLRSGIPPRWPASWALQFLESQSLRAFYVLLLLLPVSGMASDALLARTAGDEAQNERLAKFAMDFHKRLARILEFMLLPFHLLYTSAYHFAKGRGVIRKISPFV